MNLMNEIYEFNEDIIFRNVDVKLQLQTLFLGQNKNLNSPGLPCCSGMLKNSPEGVKALSLTVVHWCLTRHVAGVVMA